MMSTIKYIPPSAGNCIKCKIKPAGATPWLCFGCFNSVTLEWASFLYTDKYNEDVFASKLKQLRNKVQQKAREAFKKSNE